MIAAPKKSKAITLRLRASAGASKMPLAQAHPFVAMPVTHEETFEVSTVMYYSAARVLCIKPLASCHLIQPLEEVEQSPAREL